MSCHSRGLTSPIVMDAWSLCCPLPIRPLTSTLDRRTVRWDGAGCYDPLRSTRACQCQRTGARRGAIPVAVCHVSGSPHHPLGQSGMLRPADKHRGMAVSADRHPVWGYPCHHLPCQWGLHRGKERPATLKDFLRLSSTIFFIHL